MKYLKIVIAIMTVLAFGGPMAETQELSSPAGTDVGHKEKRFVAAVGTDGIQRVEITAGEYYFEPNIIVLKVNVPTQLIVKKSPGIVPHDIVIKAPEAGMDFKVDLKKEPRPITFTPTKPGTYEMFCDQQLLFFKSHRDRGMTGTIEVVE